MLNAEYNNQISLCFSFRIPNSEIRNHMVGPVV